MPIGNWLKYLINPISLIGDVVENVNQKLSPDMYKQDHEGILNGLGDKISDAVTPIWDDLTGKSAIELQNKLDRELAEEEYQRNLQSIGDTASAYEAAGFNRNLLYGSGTSAQPYTVPNLQAYSGSQKIDRILSMSGKILGMIPAMYQATAALEGIDQARERTKQSEIKTMSMGMNLIDQGYRLGDTHLSHPFGFTLEPFRFGNKRHVKAFDPTTLGLSPFGYDDFSKYSDAKLKNQFDLLKSIGIKNQMNSTLNNWRGYQYDLDRRYGAAGRIVGMASQGLGAVGKFLPLNSFWSKKR